MTKKNKPWVFRWVHPNGSDKLMHFGIIREISLVLSGKHSESQVKFVALSIFKSHTLSILGHTKPNDVQYVNDNIRVSNNGQCMEISIGGFPTLLIEKVGNLNSELYTNNNVMYEKITYYIGDKLKTVKQIVPSYFSSHSHTHLPISER
jgi:hypothetical protein